MMKQIKMKAKKLHFAVIGANVIAWSFLLGYFVIFKMPEAMDTPTIVMKVIFVAIVQVLYVWFMWVHRTEKGFSYRIWR